MNTLGKRIYGKKAASADGNVASGVVGRVRAVLLGALGLFAVAAGGAVIGYRSDRVDCVLVESPATASAGDHPIARFELINRTSRTVQLRPRRNQCWRTSLERVPPELRPHERREIAVVLDTGGLNGPCKFVAAISTNAKPRVIVATADVKVKADWLVKRVKLGALSAGLPAIRRIKLNNVPAERLARVGSPSDDCWSARLVSAVGRSIEIELTAAVPALDDQGTRMKRYVCDFSLYFSDADVRRLQVLATAVVVPEPDQHDPGLVSVR